MPTYCQGGDIGDLILSLATIRMLGGGHLHLIPRRKSNVQPGRGINAALAKQIIPVLEEQDYIHGAEFVSESTGINIDKWIDEQTAFFTDNVANLCAQSHGVPIPIAPGWLTCREPIKAATVVFARSPRFQTSPRMWSLAMREYARHAVFVGLPDEHATFVHDFGPVPYYPSDLHTMFRIIAGATIFCGNSSAPITMAVGLNIPTILHEDFTATRFTFPGIMNYTNQNTIRRRRRRGK